MICPHDHQECDNRGRRYGGCQGRPSRELIAHKDPALGKTSASGARRAEPRQLLSLIRQQYPGRAVGADYATEGNPKHVSNSILGSRSPLSLLRPSLGLIRD
jgi:hypothetical protein